MPFEALILVTPVQNQGLGVYLFACLFAYLSEYLYNPLQLKIHDVLWCSLVLFNPLQLQIKALILTCETGSNWRSGNVPIEACNL